MPAYSRRDLLNLLAGGVIGAALPRGPSAAPAREGPWNVVMLVSDEHSPRLPRPGQPSWVQTPHLDRLCREGVQLTRAYATSPICAPARMGLLTGRYPYETGVLSNHHIFDPRNQTIADVFRAGGYHTAAVGKTHVNHPSATYGFDVWMSKESAAFRLETRGRREQVRPLPVPAAERALWEGISDRRLRGAPIAAEWTLMSGVVLDTLSQWLAHPPREPFFVYASWTEPHWYWHLPEDLYDLYDPASIPLPPAPGPLSPVPASIRQKAGWDRMSEAQHRLCLAKYGAAITYSDRVLGRVMQLLDQNGLSEKTILVYTTDHGDMAAEKRMWLKGVMYDAAAGIPLVIRAPGLLPAGKPSRALMSGADLLPTLAGLAGVPVPAWVTGGDLTAALKGEHSGPEHLFATLSGRPGHGAPGQLMARDDRWKLIRYRQGQERSEELYDMQEDPDEARDLAKDARGRAALQALGAASERWLASLEPCPYPLLTPSGVVGDPEDPNNDVED